RGDPRSTAEIKVHLAPHDLLGHVRVSGSWTLGVGLPDTDALHIWNDPTERFFNLGELFVVSELDRRESDSRVGPIVRDLRLALIAVRSRGNPLGIEFVEGCWPDGLADGRLVIAESVTRDNLKRLPDAAVIPIDFHRGRERDAEAPRGVVPRTAR